jgi:hypothetical protein
MIEVKLLDRIAAHESSACLLSRAGFFFAFHTPQPLDRIARPDALSRGHIHLRVAVEHTIGGGRFVRVRLIAQHREPTRPTEDFEEG